MCYLMKGFYEKEHGELQLVLRNLARKISQTHIIKRFYFDSMSVADFEEKIKKIEGSIEYDENNRRLIVRYEEPLIRLFTLGEEHKISTEFELPNILEDQNEKKVAIFRGAKEQNGISTSIDVLLLKNGDIEIVVVNEGTKATERIVIPNCLHSHLNFPEDKSQIGELLFKHTMISNENGTYLDEMGLKDEYKSFTDNMSSQEPIMECILQQGVKLGKHYLLVKVLLNKEDSNTLLLKSNKSHNSFTMMLSQLFTEGNLKAHPNDIRWLKKILKANLNKLVAYDPSKQIIFCPRRLNTDPRKQMLMGTNSSFNSNF